jgi:septum formation protein
MESHVHLVLASASPRRRELLAQAGLSFEVAAPTLPELDDELAALRPRERAEALAYFKARCIWDADQSRWVLGADTIVAAGDRILGKPRDRQHAREILSALSGTRHEVITGLALLCPAGRSIASDVTAVTMRTLSPGELEEYLDSGQWRGKAGAYGIQEIGDRFVEKVEGSFSNVMGLPLELLERMLRRLAPAKEAHP